MSEIELAMRIPLPASTSTIFVEQTQEIEQTESPSRRHESSLAPTDGGFGAWSFVCQLIFVAWVIYKD